MKLEIYCVMCGIEKSIELRTDDGTHGKIDLAQIIQKAGWITQNNGKNFDIYCSKKCAS